MDSPFSVVRAETGEDGVVRILSPGVGVWSDRPAAGRLVGAGSRVGFLTTLNRRVELLLPPGLAGSVRPLGSRERALAVGFAEVLFELVPLSGAAVVAGATAGADAPGSALDGLFLVVSPTDGTFYRSPIPGAAPFVVAGSKLSTGSPVGLVEVMKTFNRIVYGGPGLPEEAEVVEVRVADAADVHAGQILVVVR